LIRIEDELKRSLKKKAEVPDLIKL
jgi:hypothetical protein